MKSKRPVIALMYDFDKTLCTKDMQEYSFIPNVRMTAQEFWHEANTLAAEKKMDGILAYMYVMLDKARSAKTVSIRRDSFVALGRDLEFYPGVESWFDRICAFGRSEGVEVRHYIISSGLREIIEGSSIFKYFTEVFACEFLYDVDSNPLWPKNVVNYTTKTQFLFRINKGVLDLSDDASLNDFTPEDERPVPFRNMIYIADGKTDVPCMKLVRVNGGCSIAVYPKNRREVAAQLLRDGRADYMLTADYSEGGELERTVKRVISKMAVTDGLKRQSALQMEKLRR